MFRKFLLSGFALLLSSGIAFASCEDGPATAEDAALKAARKVARGCTKVEMDEPMFIGSDERYLGRAKCSRKNLVCRVVLTEIEDAVCYVKSSVCSPEVTYTVPDPRPRIRNKKKCPPPGTVINCMPPTTSPYCGTSRAWVIQNCPGVTYVD